MLSVYFTANDQQKLMEELAKTDTERDRRATLDVLEDTDNEDRKQNLVLRRSVSLQLPTAGGKTHYIIKIIIEIWSQVCKFNNSLSLDYYIRNVPDLLVFDRNSSPLDESRALVPKGDRPLLRRGARTNFKRNSSVTAPNRPSLVNRKSESDCIAEQQPIEPPPMVRSASADEGVTLADHEIAVEEEEPLSPVVEEVRDLCIATRESEAPPKPIVMSRSASTSTATSNSSRKSSWSWAFWSDEKSSKKNKIDPVEEQLYIEQQELEQQHRQPQVSKSSDAASISSSATERGKRFTLSSLFSRKSKHANAANMDAIIAGSTIANEAPKDFQLNRMNMTRLPLHVERAIYKLSHVKLANPRRPLHEQVLISNQMFWYLSIIATNPPDNHHPSPHHQQQQKKKKPRKLVKKQRPPQPRRESSSKLNHTIVSGGTFLANKSARDTSTGFVVPENYLNPKHQKKKPSKADYDPKQSDSSSDDDDEEEEDDDDDDDDDGQQDDVPLALYKSTSRRAK